MANTYLTRTAGSPTSAKKFTVSGWFKIGWTDTSDHQFFQTYTNVSNREHMYFSSHKLAFICNDDGNTDVNIQTNRRLRDTSSWYHIVIAADTTQGTASNRVKFYVNGVQETSFASSTYPPQDFTFRLNTNSQSLVMGRYMGSNNYYYDGLISHFHFIDGTQYAASDFGSTDATTGEWKINTGPNVTYGNNGFFILKDGNSLTDQSPNTNNWTLGGGTLTKTEDNPSNVFATFNPLHKGTELGAVTFSNGNNTHNGTTGGASYPYSNSTLASSSGKYYAEFKRVTGDTMIGISDGAVSQWPGNSTGHYTYYQGGEVFNGGNQSWGNALNANDIVGVAMDLDNNAVYWSINGVWQNSGNPTSGSSRTGGKQITAPSSTFSGVYHFMCGKGGSSVTDIEANFGNGYFGTTAVSSNSGNGYSATGSLGIFQYQPPTGYTALCTKGLNL